MSYRTWGPWHPRASRSCERSWHDVRNIRKRTPAASLHATILDGLAPDGKTWHACQPCRSYIRSHVTQRVVLVSLADDVSRRDVSMWFAPIGRRPRALRTARAIGPAVPPFRRSASPSLPHAARCLADPRRFRKANGTFVRSGSATRCPATDIRAGNFRPPVEVRRPACVLFQTFRRSFFPPLPAPFLVRNWAALLRDPFPRVEHLPRPERKYILSEIQNAAVVWPHDRITEVHARLFAVRAKSAGRGRATLIRIPRAEGERRPTTWRQKMAVTPFPKNAASTDGGARRTNLRY